MSHETQKPEPSPETNCQLMRDMFMDASVEYAAALRSGDHVGARERLEACQAYIDAFLDLGGMAVLGAERDGQS